MDCQSGRLRAHYFLVGASGRAGFSSEADFCKALTADGASSYRAGSDSRLPIERSPFLEIRTFSVRWLLFETTLISSAGTANPESGNLLAESSRRASITDCTVEESNFLPSGPHQSE